jgi:hypothetical protein
MFLGAAAESLRDAFDDFALTQWPGAENSRCLSQISSVIAVVFLSSGATLSGRFVAQHG